MTGVFVAWNERAHSGTAGWVEDGSGCHIWVGGRNGYGYGTTHVNKRTVLVNRIRYEREIGPIPKGMDLDHYVCDNGAGGCCNPFHMRPVTRRENLLRGSSPAAHNRARTHCPRGHELAGDNLVACVLRKRGARVCWTCHRARMRAYQRKMAPVGATCPSHSALDKPAGASPRAA